MKLTKSKLQQIIKEELESISEMGVGRSSDIMAGDYTESEPVRLLASALFGILQENTSLNYLSRMNGLTDEELGQALRSASDKAENFRSAAPSAGESAAHDLDPGRFTSGT